MKLTMVLKTSSLLFGLLLGGISASADVGSRLIEIETFKTHSRLKFKIDGEVSYQWNSDKKGFEALFKNITLAELGAPFGHEMAWTQQFSRISDKRLESVRLRETPKGVYFSGVWKFPKGDLAPAHPMMETFEFREKGPDYFVIDFWPKAGPTVAQVRKKARVKKQIAALKKAEDKSKKRALRRKVSLDRETEAGDLIKFCRLPLDESKDYFLKFKVKHKKVDMSQWISKTTADTNYPYLQPKAESEEAEYVRLALKLYKQGKPALVTRTIEFFEKDYPKSAFRSEMRFLLANALLKLNLEDAALKIFRELVLNNKEDPVALHSQMFLAGRLIQNEKYYSALESFMWLTLNYPRHRLSWLFHLGAAESLYALKQTKRASNEYKKSIRAGTDNASRAHAALRMGDVYMERQQYSQALAAYYRVLKAFPEEMKKYTSIHINRGEALYQLGQFDRAEKVFQEFLKSFPTNAIGWRAAYRLGEIYGRRSMKENDAISRKWFYNAINNYPHTPAQVLARLRLLPCGDHAGFNYEVARQFLESDAKTFDGGGEVFLDSYAPMYGLTYIRTLVNMNRFEEAIKMGAIQLKRPLKKKVRHSLENTFNKVFRQRILDLIQANQKYEALALFSRYEKMLPSDHPMFMADFVLKLADSASDLELGAMSQKLIKLYQFASTNSKLERKLASALPDDDLEKVIKRSEEQIASARSLWITHGVKEKKRIREILESVSDESPNSYQKEVILAQIFESEKDQQNALIHALRAQLLMNDKSVAAGSRLTYWLINLHNDVENYQSAINLFEDLHSSLSETKKGESPEEKELDHSLALLGLDPIPSQRSLTFLNASVLEKEKRWGDAASVYQKAVDRGLQDNRILYSYGRALNFTGTVKNKEKAREVFIEVMRSEKDDFWKSLAMNALGQKVKIKKN